MQPAVRIQGLSEPFVRERLGQFVAVGSGIPGDDWGLEQYLFPLPEKWALSFGALLADGRLAGFIFCSRKPAGIHIHRLAVLENCRAQGIAALLLKQAAQEAQRRRISQITLFVDPNNEPAIDWYKKRGFLTHPCEGPNLLMAMSIPPGAADSPGLR